MQQNYKIDINGNPFNDFKQGEDTVRVTKLLTNNWSNDEDVFRISKVKDGKPKHSVDVTDTNFTKINQATKNLPNEIFEIGGAIKSEEGYFIITDIYGQDLLYTTGLGRTAPIRLGFNIDPLETYIPKDQFELSLHKTLKGQDWIIWEEGKFYVLFHYEDKVYKKVQLDFDYYKHSFYSRSTIIGNPELVCKPYQIDNAVFIENISYKNSTFYSNMIRFYEPLSRAKKQLNKDDCSIDNLLKHFETNSYFSDNQPFHNTDKRFEYIITYIQDTYPRDFLPTQWELKEWDYTEDKDFDQELFYDWKEWKTPFRVLDKKMLADENYCPYADKIIDVLGYQALLLLDPKPINEYHSGGDWIISHWIKNGEPLKAGYVNLNLHFRGDGEKNVIIDREEGKGIRDYGTDALIYCYYRKVDKPIQQPNPIVIQPKYKIGDTIVLKPSGWVEATLEFTDGHTATKEETEKSWKEWIENDMEYKNYTLKEENDIWYVNDNKSIEDRTYIIGTYHFEYNLIRYHISKKKDSRYILEKDILKKI